jgi:hypothetical protein
LGVDDRDPACRHELWTLSTPSMPPDCERGVAVDRIEPNY